jgi:hypothetical protein
MWLLRHFEIRDYLGSVAILVSIVSFIVALRSARFARRVKGSELRNEVLIKYVDAKNELTSLENYLLAVRREGTDKGDVTLLEIADRHADDIDIVRRSLTGAVEILANMPSKGGAEIYEKFLYRPHDFRTRTLNIKAAVEREVNLHKESHP